ncbi:glycosyltransferase, partial [Bacteroidota bacterium]|nr:glycosyltransferase [Bacteroidota bacterium]
REPLYKTVPQAEKEVRKIEYVDTSKQISNDQFQSLLKRWNKFQKKMIVCGSLNPVVSTNVGGIENVISVDETGYLSEVGDLEQFTINLLNLIENEGIRNKMSNKGRKRSSLYSFENLISNTKSLYNNTL